MHCNLGNISSGSDGNVMETVGGSVTVNGSHASCLQRISGSRVCPVIILEELSTSKEAEGIGVFLQRGLNSCPLGETHYRVYVSVCTPLTLGLLAAHRKQRRRLRGQTHGPKSVEAPLRPLRLDGWCNQPRSGSLPASGFTNRVTQQ